MVTSVSYTFIFAMQILILWLLNPLQIYKHSPTKLVWLVRKLLLPESFTIQHIATTKDRVPFIVLSSYAVLPVRAYKRGARLQRTGRCRSVQRFFSENKNIGLLWAKVRRFCIKSTEVCIKEVRCFALPIHHYKKNILRKCPTFPTPFHKTSFMYRLFRV